MSFQITQAGGAGAAPPSASLDEAWQGVSVTITLSVGTSYSHELLDVSEGCEAASLSGASSQIASFTPVFGVSGTYMGKSVVDGITHLWSVVVTKDDTGADWGLGLARLGVDMDRASAPGTRGPAGLLDRNLERIEAALVGVGGGGRADVPLWSCANAYVESSLAGPAWRTLGLFRPDLTQFAATTSLSFHIHAIVEYAVGGLTSHWRIVRRSDAVVLASGTLSGTPGEVGPTAITLVDDTLYQIQVDAIGVASSFGLADIRIFAREYF